MTLRASLAELARLIDTHLGGRAGESAVAAEALFGLMRGAADLLPAPACSVERSAAARARVADGVGLFLRAHGLHPGGAALPRQLEDAGMDGRPANRPAADGETPRHSHRTATTGVTRR